MNGIDPDGMFWEELGNWLTGNGWTKTMDSPGDYWAQNMTESIAQQDVSEEISRFDFMDDLASGNIITPVRPDWIDKATFIELYNGPRGIDQFDLYRVGEFQLMKENFFATIDVLKSLTLDPYTGLPLGGTYSILPPSVANRISLYFRGMKEFYYRNAFQINDIGYSALTKFELPYQPYTTAGQTIRCVSPFVKIPGM